MRRKSIVNLSSQTTAGVRVLRLYVADGAPNSVQAIANLGVICQQYLQGNFHLEIVDVVEQPLRALADGVIVTPSLIKLLPLPVVQIVGNLNDKHQVLLALGLEGNVE